MKSARDAADRDPAETLGHVGSHAAGKGHLASLTRTRQVLRGDTRNPGHNLDDMVLGHPSERRLELTSLFEAMEREELVAFDDLLNRPQVFV